MPRQPRTKSKSKVYHCILRGINKQDIFFEKQDYFKFQEILKRSKKIFSYKLYSYVLMPNHIHLEIKDEFHKLSKVMQHIATSYAQYFNKKYKRTGHVFENRYLSKNVETSSYILNLVRYIHQNPVKAGIGKIDKYEWSSYLEYLNINNINEPIVDVEDILSLFFLNKNEGIGAFLEFNKEDIKFESSIELMDYEIKNRLKDEELIYFIRTQLGIKNIQEIQRYSANYRNEIIQKIKCIKGVTQQQISRVLGIHLRIIQRVRVK